MTLCCFPELYVECQETVRCPWAHVGTGGVSLGVQQNGASRVVPPCILRAGCHLDFADARRVVSPCMGSTVGTAPTCHRQLQGLTEAALVIAQGWQLFHEQRGVRIYELQMAR